jgi:GNAT superfamily N-acetyltransferase
MPDPIPAIIIGRLAVDLRYQGAGIGQGLLRDALARAINVFGIISRIDYAASIKFLFLVISSSIKH